MRVFNVRNAIIAILTLTSSLSVASLVNSKVCSILMRKPLAEETLTSAALDFQGVQSFRSTVSVSEEQTSNPMPLVILYRHGDSWASTFSVGRNNPQGNPMWFAALVGSRAAHYFGFSEINEQTMTAPSVGFLNNRIEKLNKKLPPEARILVNFRKGEPIVDEGLPYLKSFINDFSLPIAKSGHLFLHDISFHTIAMFLPEMILNDLRVRARLAVNFSDFVTKKEAEVSPEEQTALELIRKFVILNSVRRIDGQTGNLAAGMVDSTLDTEARIKFMQQYLAHQKGYLTETPKEDLEKCIQKSFDSALYTYSLYGHGASPEKYVEVKFPGNFLGFMKMAKPFFDSLDPSYSTPNSFEAKDLLLDIHNRINEIKNLAEKLER